MSGYQWRIDDPLRSSHRFKSASVIHKPPEGGWDGIRYWYLSVADASIIKKISGQRFLKYIS